MLQSWTRVHGVHAPTGSGQVGSQVRFYAIVADRVGSRVSPNFPTFVSTIQYADKAESLEIVKSGMRLGLQKNRSFTVYITIHSRLFGNTHVLFSPGLLAL